MRFSAEEIVEAADALGFQHGSLEKVARLVSLLERLRTSSFLRSRVALKGGTALNLFLFDVPRLSVDIDLNYIGSRDRDTMLADKPKIEQAIEGACRAEGLTVRRIPSEHAGGKWIMSYTSYCRSRRTSSSSSNASTARARSRPSSSRTTSSCKTGCGHTRASCGRRTT